MNELDRQELARLTMRQQRLEQEAQSLTSSIQALAQQIEALGDRLTAEAEVQPAPAVEASRPVRLVAPPPIPAEAAMVLPIAAPPVLQPSSETSARSAPEPLTPTPSPVPEPPILQQPEPTAPRSFELQLGTYWLVRIGIVMLLTGMVFFGNYAYQSFISKLGAGGKIGLMYFSSAILLGLGAWWQRKPFRANLRNYAEVLFAGGLAAVYFTTYAAHHISHLRIISSPVLDGFLLVAWAGLIVWIADRRKSEVLAMFAIGLAYYASIITRVGYFTLWSNLVLSAAALVFLVRNRWVGLSLVSLVATYGGYVFWRFFEASAWRFPAPNDALLLSAAFLGAYWIMFTAAVFLARDRQLSGLNRAAFLTVNNGAFFALLILTMFELRMGGFWKVSLGFGLVLLALAEASRRTLSSEPLAKNFYLTQGLLLVTIGLIARFSGFNLALLLGAESVVLLALGDYRDSKVLRVGAWASGALAMFCCISALERGSSIWLPLGVGGMFFANALLSHARHPGREGQWFRFSPSWFTCLGLGVLVGAVWVHASAEHFPLVLAGTGLLLILSIHILRVPEISLFSHLYVLLAPAVWVGLWLERDSMPWWNPVLMGALTLAVMHWWQKQNMLTVDRRERMVMETTFAVLFVLVLQVWILRAASARTFMLWTAVAAVGVTIYGAGTRAWMLSAAAQAITGIGVAAFILGLAAPPRPDWGTALAPMTALVFLAMGVRDWFKRNPESGLSAREPLLKLALIYRTVAVALSIAWVLTYIPTRECPWVLMLAGVGAFTWAGWRRDTPSLCYSAIFSAFGLGMSLMPATPAAAVYLPTLLGILAIAVQERIAARFPEDFRVPIEAHRIAAASVALGVWVMASRYILQTASGFYLTATWSVVALVLFGTGVLVRERAYRWCGLLVLGCAMGRVVLFDVWKLQTLYRVLSFMALGTVLVVLGFLYNKYQERIKQWL